MNAFDNYRQMLTTLYGTIPIYLHFAPLTNIQEHDYIVPKSTKDSKKKVENSQIMIYCCYCYCQSRPQCWLRSRKMQSNAERRKYNRSLTSVDSSGGSKLSALSNKARTFLSSFKRHRKSAYLNNSISFNNAPNRIDLYFTITWQQVWTLLNRQ